MVKKKRNICIKNINKIYNIYTIKKKYKKK